MPEVGVRELKTRASEILREVRDQGTRYVITHRGRRVGVLLPYSEAELSGSAGHDPWDELIRLGREIEQRWPSTRTSAEILTEIRR